MTKDSHKVLLTQLKNPFPPQLVKWRVGGGSKQLAYIDARDVMKRLDEVMGASGWQSKFISIDGGFICELSLKIGDEWLTRSDGANNTKIEPIKGGISSALKRAANEWGIGRYLYYLDPSKFNARNSDQWPKWALPGAVENWEDIAEMETEVTTGMDEEEIVEATVETMQNIVGAKTREELKKIIEGMSADQQRIFADAISNKADELSRAENGNTNKPA